MIAPRRRGLLSVIAMVALFGVVLHAPLQVAAQDTSSSGDTSFDFKSLDGYQKGVGRTYSGDLTSLLSGFDTSATPGAEAQTPDLSKLGLFLMQGFVVQFDNGDHASSAFDKLTEQITSGAANDESFSFAEAKIDSIGDKTKAYTGSYTGEGVQGTADLVLTQKGNFIYAGLGVSFGSDAMTTTTTFVSDMSNAKPGDGDGTFNADGTSTGGLWDIFPAADSGAVKGLKPLSDQDLSQSEE